MMASVVDRRKGIKNSKPTRSDTVKALKELSKFRLSSLVLMTSSAGYLAAGGPVEVIPFTSVCMGTLLAACSAGSFNQIIESDRDSKMNRTKNRPIPSKRISVNQGIAWGSLTGLSSLAILTLGTNPITATLGMGNLVLYAVPYTLSKTRTEMNTWIGSVVGAVPPLMGWTAATGTIDSIDPLLLSSLLFLWQFPHFFALSWMYKSDYARGGFKMVPCADPTGQRTAKLITKYSIYLFPLPIVAALCDVTSWMYAVEGSGINALLCYKAFRFGQDKSNNNAKDVFKTSLWYLPVALALFVFHSKRWKENRIDNLEGENNSLRVLEGYRRKLKAMCVHEVLAKDEKANLCPVVVAEDMSEKAKEKAKEKFIFAAALARMQ